MSPDLRQIVDVAPLVQSGAVSPVTLVETCLEQIGARPEINAFIERFDRQALAEARTAEREIRSVVTAGLCTAFRCPSRT